MNASSNGKTIEDTVMEAHDRIAVLNNKIDKNPNDKEQYRPEIEAIKKQLHGILQAIDRILGNG